MTVTRTLDTVLFQIDSDMRVLHYLRSQGVDMSAATAGLDRLARTLSATRDVLYELADEQGVTLTPDNRTTHRTEVLHVRDSDGGCDIEVWTDGQRQTPVQVEDVDPGRGYTRRDWDESTVAVGKEPTYSEPFKVAVTEARDQHADNRYIDQEG